MSNLFKALKRAERDREAARLAQAGSSPRVATAVPPVTTPAADESDVAAPAVSRLQRDAVEPAERLAPRTTTASHPVSPYRGVGISLGMAILLAAVFGLWMRGQNNQPVQDGSGLSRREPARLSPPIPAALGLHEAGPLQLRLDRRVDAVGHAVQQRFKAQ